jgi:DNA polymerase-3 subunit delta'
VTRDLTALVGQDEAVLRLQRLAEGDRVPHALLFEGPDGVGKRTAAELFVTARLCHERPAPHLACGRCGSCRKIQEGTHADLTRVEPSGRNIKVAEVRSAERALRLVPLEGQAKAVIIDGADRMTPEAQNALLKTLEEPPGESLLILVAHRPRALLPTVLSRCQRLRFRPLAAETIARQLGEAEAPESRLRASLAQGSLGRAAALDGETLVGWRDDVAQLDRRLRPGSASAEDALSAAAELAQERGEMARKLDLWLLWLRDQLLVAIGSADAPANRDREADLLPLARERSSATLLFRARAVLEARLQLDLPFNLNPLLVAEQMCLALTGRGRMVPER